MLISTQPRTRSLLLGFVLLAALSGCGQQESPSIASAQPSASSRAGATPPSDSKVLDDYVAHMNRFVKCLRNHGLTKVADPDKFGRVQIVKADAPSPTVLYEARNACQPFAVSMPQAVSELVDRDYANHLTPAEKATARRYADCMQANGARDFPDPRPDGSDNDRPWDQLAPGVRAAQAKCGPIIGSPAVSGPGVG